MPLKPPAKRPRLDTPDTHLQQPPRLDPDSSLVRLHPPTPDVAGTPLDPTHPSGSQGTTFEPVTTNVDVVDLPNISVPRSNDNALPRYLLKPAMLRGMQAPNDEGFRYVVSRKFVDVKQLGTVHVEFDPEIGAYRATDILKKLPPGPALYKQYGELTWATSRAAPGKARAALLADGFKQLHPQQTSEQRMHLLQSYNLSPQQHVRLLEELSANLRQPHWLEPHKRLSEDPTNAQRFEPLRSEIEPMIVSIRNETFEPGTLPDFEDSVSPAFLRGFLEKLGYQRNLNNCLYRTDIPGLFRADDRTPYELHTDGMMLPRMEHSAGSTTETPVSATLSLEEVRMYGKGAPPAEHLAYNRQIDSRPPKSEKHATRLRQRFGFTYVIDTRGVEVVLGAENLLFNKKGMNEDAWLPDDDREAHISVRQNDGIDSQRLWLLDSTLSKGARLQDIHDQAGFDAEFIHHDTQAGQQNRQRYDELIDAVASAGKPILRLKANAFANDITWPE